MKISRRIRLALSLVPFLLLFSGCPEKKEKPAETAEQGKKAELKPSVDESLSGAWESDVRSNLLKLIAERGKGGASYDPDMEKSPHIRRQS